MIWHAARHTVSMHSSAAHTAANDPRAHTWVSSEEPETSLIARAQCGDHLRTQRTQAGEVGGA